MKYSYGFRNGTILYRTAREFGKKVYQAGVLTELGGNPYDPDNTDYDDFNTGYRYAREQDKLAH